MSYEVRALDESTWDAFSALVEHNNGVWGGCWCMGFHPEGVGHPGQTREGNRQAKLARVCSDRSHAALVFEGDECVGWCQYGPPAELPNVKNTKAYEKELTDLPDWRITCTFAGKGHRRKGVGMAAVRGALEAIRAAGGGVVEAYPEQVEDRKPQPGAFFHTGPEDLFTELGFTRDRKIAKWRWVMRLEV
ncbi:hypothetical protein [Luteipulveratus mongoliensis]|uniref:GCN5 family acetyltransferase n=1 Tax=Luteipulveratus mongoliensis TaxID=571913 RepID=A0A0K1JE96_9MICO|nr:hypothetical protein [Luteipulveratus mongoliensis]AKU15037.1 GCN5 family acetyltransferase [Luteipulveratus mongoliensis]